MPRRAEQRLSLRLSLGLVEKRNMMDVRSYVTFIDDHEEDVVYFKVFDERHILFATESGVYFYKKAPDTPGVFWLYEKEDQDGRKL